MTIEEKAKAYDEALEKAKIEINTKGIGETVDLCEQLFPQLTESEDERIRKWLLDYAIEMIAALESDISLSTYDGIKGHDPEAEAELAQWQKARAYLERQKESLHTQEMCKENANSFADGIIEVRSFQRGMEEGRRLEKQKEQKHNYCLYGGYPSVGRCRWCYAACSARLADVHTDEEKEYIRTIKSIISDFIRDKKPENLAYYQKIYDWLDGRYVPFSCGHENGEPAEEDGPFDEDEFLEGELSAFLQNYDKEYDDDAAVSDVARHFYEIGKKQNEQKSVPFSCGHENGQPLDNWKPSEEQMEALKNTAYLAKTSSRLSG